MLQIAILLVVITAAALAIRWLRSPAVGQYDEDVLVDLPCPWCRAPTREDDTACPVCERPFAVAG